MPVPFPKSAGWFSNPLFGGGVHGNTSLGSADFSPSFQAQSEHIDVLEVPTQADVFGSFDAMDLSLN